MRSLGGLLVNMSEFVCLCRTIGHSCRRSTSQPTEKCFGEPPLMGVRVLISFRESCLIPQMCLITVSQFYYLTSSSLYSVPVYFFLPPPPAIQIETKEIELEPRWFQCRLQEKQPMLHTYSDRKVNFDIYKLWMIIKTGLFLPKTLMHDHFMKLIMASGIHLQ